MSRKARLHTVMSPGLQRVMRILSLLALGMLAVLVYDVLSGQVRPLFALFALLLGVVLGWVFGSAASFGWDEETSRVVSRTGWFGTVVLVAYLVFAVLRTRLVDVWVDDATQVAGVSLALGLGALVGRVLALGSGMRKVWKAWLAQAPQREE